MLLYVFLGSGYVAGAKARILVLPSERVPLDTTGLKGFVRRQLANAAGTFIRHNVEPYIQSMICQSSDGGKTWSITVIPDLFRIMVRVQANAIEQIDSLNAVVVMHGRMFLAHSLWKN